MGLAIKIKMLLAAREMTLQDLANQITPKTSVQNISQKLKRDNFSEKELQAIAKACDATFEANFILNDTGKVIYDSNADMGKYNKGRPLGLPLYSLPPSKLRFATSLAARLRDALVGGKALHVRVSLCETPGWCQR